MISTYVNALRIHNEAVTVEVDVGQLVKLHLFFCSSDAAMIGENERRWDSSAIARGDRDEIVSVKATTGDRDIGNLSDRLAVRKSFKATCNSCNWGVSRYGHSIGDRGTKYERAQRRRR